MTDHGYTDEQGNAWTLEELLADLDRGDNLYLTPKMCADLAKHLRQHGPSVPLELLEDCLAKIEAYSRELQGRYCGGVPNNILLPQLREAIKRLGATPSPIDHIRENKDEPHSV